MFITREYDYALRILRILAESEQLTVKQICVSEHIPQPYSYKILKKLEKAGFVKAHRGTQGGYRLITQPASISLYDVYTAVEGELYINDCMKEGYYCPNNDTGRHCTIHKELCNMQNHVLQGLRERTMADML